MHVILLDVQGHILANFLGQPSGGVCAQMRGCPFVHQRRGQTFGDLFNGDNESH